MARRDEASEELLLNTLRDFTSKENWDKFFTIRGGEDPFEWYAEWASLRDPILSQLSVSDDVIAGAPSPLQILVPGCGNSRLSEHLYDAGFRGVTNIDFSKVVVSDMLRRNVRSRPEMRWRVMDMTQMQFTDESFDAVLDKGGLDALMEPELGPKLGSRYVSEVKRVLKSGGKFVCLTLAESHVLGLLFSKFRFGWKINIHAIPHTPSKQPSFQTFMVVVVKDQSTMLHEITSSFNCSSLDCDGTQVRGLFQALDSENKIRRELSSGADILFSLEDLQLGAKGDLKVLIPGRRFQLLLGEEGGSLFSYKAVLLDAKEQSDPFIYHCGVFLVPKIRAHEWLLSSEEGQWLVVESSKAARLIMVFLDARHTHASMDEIQKDLSPLVKGLVPSEQDNGVQIPFMMANDGVKQRDIIHQATSAMTGQIVVEDVIYEKVDGSPSGLNSSKDMTFRRLIFERNLGVLQSEALLMTEGFLDNGEKKRKTNSMSKSKRKGSQRRSTVAMANGSRNTVKVDHQYLASSYHTGIISGFMLVASNLERLVSSRQMAKTVVIGLGAGLLPMFLHGCMPCLTIEVVELDPIIVNLARDYFGFNEDEHLKVHVADGIEFIRKLKNITASTRENVNHENDETISKEKFPSANGNDTNHLLEGKDSIKIDILIVDVDSSDSSSGMTCPHADFVEESFLLSVKESLSEGGLFVVNLVSRSPTIREMVISRMKAVFRQLFCLQIEEDVNEVLFALPSDLSVTESFSEAALQLQKLLKFTEQDRDQNILATTKKIKHLK